MRTQTVAALVLALACASGPDLAAQAPEPSRRLLIVADAMSIQFRSTPRVRDLMSRTQRVFSRTGDVVRIVATGGAYTGAPGSTINNVVGHALAPRAVGTATPGSSDARELRHRSELSSSTVAAALQSISAEGSGPITVVYVTEGYPSFAPAPTEFIEKALRVNATVYVIDPRGWSDTGRQFDAKDWEAYVAATQESVRALASRTKGTAILTREDFDALLSSL